MRPEYNLQKLKIPKISTGELLDIEFTDYGNTLSYTFSTYTGIFKIDGKEYRSDFQGELKGKKFAEARYKHDVEFLKKHDLDLEKVIW